LKSLRATVFRGLLPDPIFHEPLRVRIKFISLLHVLSLVFSQYVRRNNAQWGRNYYGSKW